MRKLALRNIKLTLQDPKYLSVTATFLALILLPFLVSEAYFLHLMILSIVFGISASSWDITMGYCGIFNFSHMTFFGVAAYASAILSKTFGMSPWISMLLGALFAVLASLLCGLPSLRLSGVYIAMFTLLFMQLVGLFVLFDPFGLTNGPSGIQHVPPLSVGPINFGGLNKIPNYFFALMILTVTVTTLHKILKSSIGLALRAVRDNENLAMARGINPNKYKMISWVISAFFNGLAGAFYVHYNQVATIEIFSFILVAQVLSYLVVGGLGTLYGPIIGSFFMTFLSEQLRGIAGYRLLIFAISIILIAQFARGGLYHLVQIFFAKIQGQRRVA